MDIDIARYFFLDWMAMALSFTAVWSLGNKRRHGFVIFALANLIWIGVGIMASSVGIVIGNLGFLGSNVRGFIRWSAAMGSERSSIDRSRP